MNPKFWVGGCFPLSPLFQKFISQMPSIGSICRRNELLREELGGGFLPEIRAGNLSKLFNGPSF